jgi:arylsulfatase
VGGKVPTDRPIDGVDQSDVLLGRSPRGHRESLLTFIGPDLVAVRWNQWRIYYRDIHPTGEGAQRLSGLGAASGEMNGYPKIFNIEMDPSEQLNLAWLFPWVLHPALSLVLDYEASLKDHPNPPAPNVTRFRGGD